VDIATTPKIIEPIFMSKPHWISKQQDALKYILEQRRLNPEKPDIVVQDKAPPGGYPPIRYRRSLAQSVIPPWVIILGVVAMSTYGAYQLRKTIHERVDTNEEKKRRRIAIIPYLVAEEDEKRIFSSINKEMIIKRAVKTPDRLQLLTGNKNIYETRDERFIK